MDLVQVCFLSLCVAVGVTMNCIVIFVSIYYWESMPRSRPRIKPAAFFNFGKLAADTLLSPDLQTNVWCQYLGVWIARKYIPQVKSFNNPLLPQLLKEIRSFEKY